MVLIEKFLAGTLATGKKINAQLQSASKDVGIFLYQFQPQIVLRLGYKKSSVRANCLVSSESHVFAAQAEKAVINVYSQKKGNQEATVPLPERAASLAYVKCSGILVIGTEGGRIFLWEAATGRLTTSAASHLLPVTSLCVTENSNFILSASEDSSVHIWSLPRFISFAESIKPWGSTPSNAPLQTFSGHESKITALVCGHSKSSTNFAVSASTDNICYIWNISDCRILQTVLLPSSPLCVAIDPADRAIYFGYEDGGLQLVDLYSKREARETIFNNDNSVPRDLTLGDVWPVNSSEIGAAKCLTVSYDGTTILSGHDSGKIVSWDVSRGEARNVIDLGQSVTNIAMIKPDGFLHDRPAVEIGSVVKPKLDLSGNTSANGSSGIPATYELQAQVTKCQISPQHKPARNDFLKALRSPYYDSNLVTDAIQGLFNSDLAVVDIVDLKQAQIEKLEAENEDLRANLKYWHDITEKSKSRRIFRMKKRHELNDSKESAYFAAVQKGEDGYEAMRPWEEKIKDLNVGSDEEELAQGDNYGDVNFTQGF